MRVKAYNEPSLISSIGNENYLLRWDVKKDNEVYSYEECIIKNPTINEIKELIINYYNKQCGLEIVQGFYFEGNQVWLTTENTFNYKAAADLAYQTNGTSLPTTFKFGTTGTPVYRVFKEVEDLQNFHVKFISYIDTTLKKYREIKDNIDWNKYELE